MKSPNALRDQRVLQAMAKGDGDDEIARREGMTNGSIRVYNHHLYKRLGARNRAHAVAIFLTRLLYVTPKGLSSRPLNI